MSQRINNVNKAIDAMSAPHIPNKLRIVTIIPARQIPISMHSNAGKNFIPNIYAAIEPVHAPVMGSGIITKSINPKDSYFFMREPFFLVLAKSQTKNLLNKGTRDSRSSPNFSIRRMIGMGIKFPATPSKYALYHGIL